KELRLANKEAEAQVYLQRLLILDPGAALDGKPAGNASPSPPAAPRKAEPEPTKLPLSARGQVSDDPFHDDNSKQKEAQTLLQRAEQEFAAQHYEAAGRLFEQASQADPHAPGDGRGRWAFCKLNRVVEELNRPGGSGTSLATMEQEVRQALSLAPSTPE